MKINKSKAPARGWVKKSLCGGAILGLAASMGAPTALASGFETFTPFSRIATLPVVYIDGTEVVDHAATYAKGKAAALFLAEYVARTKDTGDGGDWVLGGTSKDCRKHTNWPLDDCSDEEIKDAILGIPSPDKIDPDKGSCLEYNPDNSCKVKNVKKASVLDFCNEHYASQALGVAPIIGEKGDPDAKYVVNGYSHTPALPCEVSIWNDEQNIYVDMLDPIGIFTLFFTDVHFSKDMKHDSDFAKAISDLPPAVKDEIKDIVQDAMDAFDSNADTPEVAIEIGPEYDSMAQVIEAVDAAPEDSPYKHVGYKRRGGGDFDSGDALAVTKAIIETMSVHGDDDQGTHDTPINKKGETLDSILSPGSSWRSARHDPLPLPGKNYIIEACSPKFAKMAMGTGLGHVTALPCEITVQVIDQNGDGSKETLVVSYLDPHFMLGALFADISAEDKAKFADIPGIIMDDLQKIVAAALDVNSGYVLNKGKKIKYDMLPQPDDYEDYGL